ncbi:acyltransferase family protein [Modestobacter versicolor]|uniref:acyltransferase family protein n=1 Tax=Modestobacter versicolor TaxID=429133 RepID=UPI0034DF7E51
MSTTSPTQSASEPLASTPVWLPGIDVLRGIASAAVVVHHTYSLANRPDVPGGTIVEGLGSWGVDLFFILSGYLLCDYFWRPKERRSLKVFWVRRFFRVAPAYYVQVLLLFLFFAAPSLLFSAQGLKQVLTQVTFTHYYTPNTSSSLNVNGALWTLSIEMTLYLTMPLLALAVGWPATRGRRALAWPLLAVAGLIGLAVAYRLLVSYSGGGLQDLYFGAIGPESVPNARLYLARQFPAWIGLFALGIGLRWLIVNKQLPARLLGPTRHRVSLFVLLLLPSLAWLLLTERAVQYTHPFLFAGFDLALGVLLLPALVYAARPSSSDEGGALIRAGVWLGDRSYGLYLWHFPVILVVYERGTALLPPDTSNPLFRVTAIAVLSVGLAMLSYRFVEAPARDYGRDLSRRLAPSRAARPPALPDEAAVAGTSPGDGAPTGPSAPATAHPTTASPTNGHPSTDRPVPRKERTP